jgi:hypothetical protein
MSTNTLSDTDKDIIKLWEQGFSGSHIGKELCITRNSVMGRIHRLRAAGVVVASRTTDAAFDMPKKKDYRKPYPAPKPEPLPIDRTKGVSFWDIRSGDCKFIVNDGAASSYIFCGVPADAGSYCKEHYNLCYVPPEPKRRRKHSYQQPATTMGEEIL